MDIINWLVDIHKSIMDIHDWICGYPELCDYGYPYFLLWISIIPIMDIHNDLWISIIKYGYP